MNKRRIGGAALCLLTGLSGCAAISVPYSEVVGERMARADLYEEDVLILAVDTNMTSGGLAGMARGGFMPGQPPRQAERIERPSLSDRVVIEPGFRLLRLATVRHGRTKDSDLATVPLNAKPCTRYYFVARHESPTVVEPWQVVLKHVKPIGECTAKFPDAAAPSAPPAAAASSPV